MFTVLFHLQQHVRSRYCRGQSLDIVLDVMNESNEEEDSTKDYVMPTSLKK